MSCALLTDAHVGTKKRSSANSSLTHCSVAGSVLLGGARGLVSVLGCSVVGYSSPRGLVRAAFPDLGLLRDSPMPGVALHALLSKLCAIAASVHHIPVAVVVGVFIVVAWDGGGVVDEHDRPR